MAFVLVHTCLDSFTVETIEHIDTLISAHAWCYLREHDKMRAFISNDHFRGKMLLAELDETLDRNGIR